MYCDCLRRAAKSTYRNTDTRQFVIFRGYNVEKETFGAPVGSLSLPIAYETDNFRRFCMRVLDVPAYTKGAVGFDGSVSTAIAGNLHTDPAGKGVTL